MIARDMQMLTNYYIQILFKDYGLLKFYIPRFFMENIYELIYGSHTIRISLYDLVASVKTKSDAIHIVDGGKNRTFETSILYYNKILFKAGETYICDFCYKSLELDTLTAKDIKIFNYDIGGLITARGYISGPLHII